MTKQLNSMLTRSICNELFPTLDINNQLNIEEGLPWLVTTVKDELFYVSGEWGIKFENVAPLLAQIKEHITLLHCNKIFVRVEGFPKIDNNGYPELEIFCRYTLRRDNIYLEKVEEFEPSLSPIDKTKYKARKKK